MNERGKEKRLPGNWFEVRSAEKLITMFTKQKTRKKKNQLDSDKLIPTKSKPMENSHIWT